MAMFLLMCLLCACAAPAALPALRPQTNNDFSSLLVRDHASAAAVFADDSFSQFNSFWHLEKDPKDRGGPPQDSTPETSSPIAENSRKAARRLAEFNSIILDTVPQRKIPEPSIMDQSYHVMMPVLDGTSGARVVNRGLRQAGTQGTVGGDGLRTEVTRMVNIFYRYSDNSTAITEEMVKKVRVSVITIIVLVVGNCHSSPFCP